MMPSGAPSRALGIVVSRLGYRGRPRPGAAPWLPAGSWRSGQWPRIPRTSG